MFRLTRSKSIDSLRLVGDTTILPTSDYLQTPNPDLIKALRAKDKRVHHYPIARNAIQDQESRFVFYRGTDGLADQIVRDIPQDPKKLALRGLTLSLRGCFTHFTPAEAEWDINKWGWDIDASEHLEMNDIASVLKTGTDRKGFFGHAGKMGTNSKGSPELNIRSHEWMYQHWEAESVHCVEMGHPEDANRLFPSLLVYDIEALRPTQGGRIRPEALLAVYVTDRVVDQNHKFLGALDLSTVAKN